MPKNEIPTAKPYRPNWKNIFSQLGNYFFTVKYNLTANKYTEAFQPLFSGYYCCLFLIVLRDNETSCQTKIRKAKTCLNYYDLTQSSIKTELGRLLRPSPVVYYDRSQPSLRIGPNSHETKKEGQELQQAPNNIFRPVQMELRSTPVRAKALLIAGIFKAFALTGRLADCLYTQGVALG